MSKFFLLVISTIILSGCSTIFTGNPERPISLSDDLATTKFAFETSEIEKYRAATGEAKQVLRDEIVEARIRAYDIKFSEFEEHLYSFGIGTGIGTDWTTLAISGLTAVIGGTQTKAALGAANTAIIGAKGSIDKRLFLEKTTPALIAEMERQRSRTLLDIRKGLSQKVSNYNLFRGLSDLERYRRAGSLSGGLTGIIKSAGAEIETNENKISSIVQVTYLADNASNLVEKFWMPDGQTVNQSNQKKIISCMSEYGLSTTKPGQIATFIIGSDFKDLRLKVVKCLKLEDQK